MLNGDIDVLELTGDITNVLSLEGNLLPIGPKGDKGDPGFSPVVTTSKSGKTTTVKFETATGDVYAYIQDGADGEGKGDMLTDVYDQNKNGIVDNAEKVNNHTVEKDVPANADFSDTKAIWGNITGTLTNQTDLNTALGNKANTSDLSTVATSGSYNDLSNKPTNVSTFTNDANYVTSNGNAESTQTNVSSATFTNTLEAPMNIDLKGNTLQNGTPTPSSPIPINNVSGDNDIVVFGKNLIDVSKGRLGNWGGLTFTSSSNGELIVNGTNSSAVDVYLYIADQYNIPLVNFLNNKTGTYTLSNDKGFENYFRLTSGFKQNTATISPQDTTINCFVRIPAGTYNNLSIKVQIEQGNQATTYEAYNGTTYNIDLPVENIIENTASTTTTNGITFTILDDKSIRITGTATAKATLILNDTSKSLNANDYTLSTGISNKIGFSLGVQIGTSYYSTSSSKTITLSNTTNFIKMYIDIEKGTTMNDILKPQLELSSKANSYTPYGTTPIELNKIGTYQDYFYKQDDKWYLHKEVGKVVLNGSESDNDFNTGTSGNFTRFGYLPFMNTSLVKVQSDYVSNYFKYLGTIGGDTTEAGISNTNVANFNRCFIFVPTSTASTISAFKTWLTTHNTSIYYVLATPTNTEITYTPLIEQLESIKNAMSKEGTTNVNQVNNDAPFMLDLSVFNDTYNGRYQSVLEMYKRLKEAE